MERMKVWARQIAECPHCGGRKFSWINGGWCCLECWKYSLAPGPGAGPVMRVADAEEVGSELVQCAGCFCMVKPQEVCPKCGLKLAEDAVKDASPDSDERIEAAAKEIREYRESKQAEEAVAGKPSYHAWICLTCGRSQYLHERCACGNMFSLRKDEGGT